ncbi:MAG: glycoside-pentoside-hexuronide (GPH):cation symporter [Amphiplicatus sp.]
MSHSSASPSRLGWRERLSYGAGDFGLNFYWQGAGYFLLFYYTDVAGLPSTAAGIAFAVGGLVDAVTDPAMGILADRTRSRWGPYRPYLLYGAVPLSVAFTLLFTLPTFAPAGWALAAALGTHVLFRVCYTCVSIPYGALGARLTFNASERTTLAGVRMIGGALGGVVMVLTVSALRNAAPDSTAFLFASALAGIAGAALVWVTFAGAKEPPVLRADQGGGRETYSISRVFKALTDNRPFLITVAAIFLLTVANMVVVKTALYRFEHILVAPLAAGFAITLMTAAPIAAIPMWVWIYIRIDKRPAFLCGCATVIASLAALYLTGAQNVLFAIVAYTAVAIGFSSFAVGFWSVLPDTIDYGHLKSGLRVESGAIGLASAIQKIAIALTALGIGVVFDAIGYQPGEAQDPATATALHQFISLTPIVFMLGSALVFSRYPITSSRHADIVAQIRQTDGA